MWKELIIAAATLVSCSSAAETEEYTAKDLNNNFHVSKRGIDNLMSKAQRVDGRDNNRVLDNQYYNTNSHISTYSIQFQGCHHIQHWNDDADDEDVRLETKRLARFRLVPTGQCSTFLPWASTNGIFGKVDYGEYIVDLNTFVASYLDAKQNESNDDNSNGEAFNIYDYAGCAQLDFQGDEDGDAVAYYLGPSCAKQGGQIRMNLFIDDTCTELVQCGSNKQVRGADCYKQMTGSILPGSNKSIIKDPCFPCTENYLSLNESANSRGFSYSNFDYGYTRDVCSNLYDVSGKCEKHMNNGQYNNACKYMEGIQIGVSREGYAVAVRRSAVADGFMLAMLIGCGFMGMYISHLKKILKR